MSETDCPPSTSSSAVNGQNYLTHPSDFILDPPPWSGAQRARRADWRGRLPRRSRRPVLSGPDAVARRADRVAVERDVGRREVVLPGQADTNIPLNTNIKDVSIHRHVRRAHTGDALPGLREPAGNLSRDDASFRHSPGKVER